MIQCMHASASTGPFCAHCEGAAVAFGLMGMAEAIGNRPRARGPLGCGARHCQNGLVYTKTGDGVTIEKCAACGGRGTR